MDDYTKIIAGVILGLVILVIILMMVISSLRKKIRKIKEQADEDVNTARLIAKSEVASAQKAAKSEIQSVRATCENEKRAINDKCNETIISIKKDCDRQIRHIKEDIENERATLSKMNEKEILIRIMLALNGYGNRLDRLEQNLKDDRVVDRINNLFEKTTTIISGVSDNLIEQIDIMNDSILRSIYDSSIINKLDEISSAIGETRSDVCDVYNLNIEYDMDDVKYKIDTIISTVTEIQESIGNGNNYNSSTFYDIDDVMSAVNDTKELAENARDAAERAKDAAESTKDTVESHFY